MPELKLSAAPAAQTLADADLFAVSQSISGQWGTRKATGAQLKTFLNLSTALQGLGGLPYVAGSMSYFTGATTPAVTPSTSFGRGLLNLADATAGRTAFDAAATAHTHAATDITSGFVATARLGSGTANNTTFLRGDGTWAVPAGGGGGGGDLLAANNLSDLANANTARTNLGLGTAATQASTAFAAASHTHAAADTTSGVFATARLGTGTANSSTFLRGDGTWAAPAGGGSEVNAFALPSALSNPASPVTPSGLTGSSVVRITGITGNKTLNAPTIGSVTGRLWVLYDISATGGPFTITMGTNFAHDGTGSAPTFTVPSGGTLQIATYSDDGTNWKYSGDYDFASNKAAILSALGMGTLKARFDILSPANGTEILLLENMQIGTILSALCWTDTGSATLNLQIADKTGSTNYTPTGAASITGLSAVAVTTTPTRTAATAANTMAKTGTSDRILQAVLSSVTGSPNKLSIEVEWTL